MHKTLYYERYLPPGEKGNRYESKIPVPDGLKKRLDDSGVSISISEKTLGALRRPPSVHPYVELGRRAMSQKGDIQFVDGVKVDVTYELSDKAPSKAEVEMLLEGVKKAYDLHRIGYLKLKVPLKYERETEKYNRLGKFLPVYIAEGLAGVAAASGDLPLMLILPWVVPAITWGFVEAAYMPLKRRMGEEEPELYIESDSGADQKMKKSFEEAYPTPKPHYQYNAFKEGISGIFRPISRFLKHDSEERQREYEEIKREVERNEPR